MDQVTPRLFLGSRSDAANPALLKQHAIDAVLSLEPVRLIASVRCQLILQLKDRQPMPLATLEQAVDFIALQIEQGRRVLVHCQMGISRSPTLVLAYLHRHAGLSLDQALARIQRARPQAEPHPVLLQSLSEHYASPISRGRIQRAIAAYSPRLLQPAAGSQAAALPTGALAL